MVAPGPGPGDGVTTGGDPAGAEWGSYAADSEEAEVLGGE